MRYVDAALLSETARARLREVYESAFPPGLGSDFDGLFADRVHAYLDEGDAVAGITVHRPLGDTGWVFLRYFAAARRGQGTGSRMWRDLASVADGATRVVLDVEHPDEPGIPDAEADVRRRRVVFYERLGVRVLPVTDYAPPHDDGAHPMLLLAAALASGDGTSRIDAEEVRRVVLAAYLHRYGLAEDDPAVVRTLLSSGL